MAKTAANASANPDHPESLVLIDKYNLAVLRTLAEDLVGERPPAAFIGAGLTARAGFPTWDGLIDRFVQQIGSWKKPKNSPPGDDLETQMNIGDVKFSSNDLLWRANFCFDFFELAERRDDYFAELTSQFAKPSGENPVLDQVIKLPFAQFLTTNYDPSICDAHSRVHGRKLKSIDWGLAKPATGLPSGRRAARCCVHLHGCHTRAEGIILREDDYQARYFENGEHVDALKRFLRANPVVFIGYSLGDLDVMNVLRMLKARHPAQRGSHYAILPLSDEKPDKFIEMEKRRLNDKYGIHAIFYRRLTNDFLGLEETVKLLSKYVGLYESAKPAPGVPPRPAARKKKKAGFSFNERALAKPKVADDPNKYAFGGLAERNGRLLSAVVTRTGKDSRWFRIELRVEALPGYPELPDGGKFYVHPTFPKTIYDGKLEDGGRRIQRKFWAYGAFTVGVLVDKRATALELDLADLRKAPKDFREN